MLNWLATLSKPSMKTMFQDAETIVKGKIKQFFSGPNHSCSQNVPVVVIVEKCLEEDQPNLSTYFLQTQ